MRGEVKTYPWTVWVWTGVIVASAFVAGCVDSKYVSERLFWETEKQAKEILAKGAEQ